MELRRSLWHAYRVPLLSKQIPSGIARSLRSFIPPCAVCTNAQEQFSVEAPALNRLVVVSSSSSGGIGTTKLRSCELAGSPDRLTPSKEPLSHRVLSPALFSLGSMRL